MAWTMRGSRTEKTVQEVLGAEQKGSEAYGGIKNEASQGSWLVVPFTKMGHTEDRGFGESRRREQ